MRCLWLVWCLITWISVILCTIGCILPYWLNGKIEKMHHFISNTNLLPNQQTHISTTLNLFRRCVYPVYLNSEQLFQTNENHENPNQNKIQKSKFLIKIQNNCGYYEFTNIPHFAWRVGLILLIIACTILMFTTIFLTIIGFQLYLLWHYYYVYRTCQIGLIISGLLVLFCCALFPIGWDDNYEVMQICGERSSQFDLGHCQLGWAYMLTLIGGILSIFCAILPNLCFPYSKRQIQIQSNMKDSFQPDSIINHEDQIDRSVKTGSTSLQISNSRIHMIGNDLPWIRSWTNSNTSSLTTTTTTTTNTTTAIISSSTALTGFISSTSTPPITTTPIHPPIIIWRSDNSFNPETQYSYLHDKNKPGFNSLIVDNVTKNK